jgi:hypothetical protein
LGRKHFGKREYFFLCVAGLIFFTLLSCAPLKEKPAVQQERPKPVIIEKVGCIKLEILEKFEKPDDFEVLLKQNEEMLATPQKGKPADELLFTLGLLYAHPENPNKSYKKSLSLFKRVINEYPRSICVGEAKIWAGVLDDIERAAKVDVEIEQKKKELGK